MRKPVTWKMRRHYAEMIWKGLFFFPVSHWPALFNNGIRLMLGLELAEQYRTRKKRDAVIRAGDLW